MRGAVPVPLTLQPLEVHLHATGPHGYRCAPWCCASQLVQHLPPSPLHLSPTPYPLLPPACHDGLPQGHHTALHFAAHHGHAAAVAVLLRQAGAEPDARDRCQHTPLHHAAALGHWRVLEELWPK